MAGASYWMALEWIGWIGYMYIGWVYRGWGGVYAGSTIRCISLKIAGGGNKDEDERSAMDVRLDQDRGMSGGCFNMFNVWSICTRVLLSPLGVEKYYLSQIISFNAIQDMV